MPEAKCSGFPVSFFGLIEAVVLKCFDPVGFPVTKVVPASPARSRVVVLDAIFACL